jgi:hypothetical protein
MQGLVEEELGTECRVRWKSIVVVLNAGSSVRVLSLKRGAVSLIAGFGGRGAQYWLSTECRVWWKRCAVFRLVGMGVQYWHSTECRVWWKRSVVLNAGSGGRVLSQY